MTKKERRAELIKLCQSEIKTKGNLRTIRRKILKLAPYVTKQELIDIWDNYLKKPTEEYYKADGDANNVDHFRRTVWKRRTQKAKDNLLEKAKDFERRSYNKGEKAKQADRKSNNMDDFIDVERSNTSTDVIAIQKPVNKDKLLSLFMAVRKAVLDHPDLLPEDSDKAYEEAKMMIK